MKLDKLVKTAVHCSVFLCPSDPGLTSAEIIEVGRRLGFHDGELTDALRNAQQTEEVQQFFGRGYLVPKQDPFWCEFHFREDSDFRNVEAFDFVRSQLLDIARKQGANNAQIERSVLVERGTSAGFKTLDIEAAITVMVLGEHCAEKDSMVRLAPGRVSYPLASEQLKQSRGAPARSNELKRTVFPIVEDLIARRTDGRAASVEPLDAFADALDKLGFRPFRMWWIQTVAELRKLEPTMTPVSATVLAAALVEGALTFVVKHARNLNMGPFRSKDFDGDPRSWSINDLVKSAASGSDTAVLDAGTRQRAEDLIRTRQRIHAGRMLSEFPGGPPDLRPEEARDARRSAEVVVRRILDWLEKYPPSGS
jgi:hypothetical protein